MVPGSLPEWADSWANHTQLSGPGAAAAAHASCNTAYTVSTLQMHSECSADVPFYFPGVGPILQVRPIYSVSKVMFH